MSTGSMGDREPLGETEEHTRNTHTHTHTHTHTRHSDSDRELAEIKCVHIVPIIIYTIIVISCC
jgi:hypothetical protein